MKQHDGTAEKSETVGQWIKARYLEYQRDSLHRDGELASLDEFAQFLGMNRSTLSMHMADQRVPSDDAINNYAAKLKNDTIYDIVGKPRPDEVLRRVISHWGKYSQRTKDRIAAIDAAEVGE